MNDLDYGETVSTGDVERMVGVSAATLNYWVHRGVLTPTKVTGGSGDPRRWSKVDLAGILVLYHCRDLGLTRVIQANMVGFMGLGGWPLVKGYLVASARAIGYIPPGGELLLPAGDMAVIAIDLAGIVKQVEEVWPKMPVNRMLTPASLS